MDEAAKAMTPIAMVAREMSDHCDMTADQIQDAIKRTLNVLRKRASDAIAKDDAAESTVQIVNEYQAIAEMVNFFGSQLIAFEDLDVYDADRIKN